jgi:outer membrane protein OmpA-like peptidoglycan-associated protein
MWKSITFCVLALVGIQHTMQGQDTIYLTNPSFEDYPRPGKPPTGWYDCGFPGETPPDVQPDATFSVSKAASHGDSYIGMVVRDNDTWESVSQRLGRPLQKGKCYNFSMDLARSELYISVSRVSEETANYATPAKVRIYGGFGYCDKQYLLAESKLIINHRWLRYNFRFEPPADYTYIILEVFYQTPTLFPYNGNVLIDNASPVTMIPCDDDPPIEPVQTDEPVATTPKPAPTPPRPTPQREPVEEVTPPQVLETSPPKPERKIVLGGKEVGEIREGATIRIDKLFFESNKAVIKQESFETLDEVYSFLQGNPDVLVEIGGHSNGLASNDFANKLSTDRAQAVADYLVDKGVGRDRLRSRGYGKSKPIASNASLEGRRQNQRVEIKIIGFRKN